MSDSHGHDAWHQHSTGEGAPQHEHGAHMTVKALGMTFIVMTVGVIVTILLLVWFFNTTVSKYKAMQTEGTSMMEPAFNAKLAARKQLGEFGWIDRDAKTVHIPVESAMQRVLADYANNQRTSTPHAETTTPMITTEPDAAHAEG